MRNSRLQAILAAVSLASLAAFPGSAGAESTTFPAGGFTVRGRLDAAHRLGSCGG